MSLFKVAATSSLVLAAGACCAASAAGDWKGQVVAQLPPVPAHATPELKAKIKMVKAQMAKVRVFLVLKSDRTFVSRTVGAPGQKEPLKGRWSQQGNTVTMTQGKPGEPSQKLTLSPDGRTLTMLFPNGKGRVVFTR